MKRAMVTALMFLALCAWAAAQNYPSQNSRSTTSAQTITIQGCLSRTDGGFRLTDNTGTKYELGGDTVTLNHHVGHEVQITGTKAESGTPSSTSGATTNQGEARIDVSRVKHISKTCNSEKQNPPMSEKPPTPQR